MTPTPQQIILAYAELGIFTNLAFIGAVLLAAWIRKAVRR